MSKTNVDLNLLRQLDALLTQRSVTLAARHLGVSQPSMSASLAKLRRHFADQLLIPKGRVSHLTPLGLKLRNPAHTALMAAQRAMAAEMDFDPATLSREFYVVASEHDLYLLSPTIMALLAAEAPNAWIHFISLSEETIQGVDHLANGDVILMPMAQPHGMALRECYLDSVVGLVSEDNQEVGGTITTAQLEALPWVVTRPGPGADSFEEKQMDARGIAINVRASVGTMTVIPSLVEAINGVACLPALAVAAHRQGARIRTVELPFDVPELPVSIVWHPAHTNDPEHAFLRDILWRAAAPLRQK
jgi:DNA-binding transcriptional LysR family regulator